MRLFQIATICVAALLCNPCAAREAVVQSFDGATRADFLMLEPGLPSVDPLKRDDIQEAAPVLMAVFEDFGRSDPSTDLPSVPVWMQSRPNMGETPQISSCSLPPYLPHVSLRPAEELRRSRYFAPMADAACKAGVPVDLFDALIIQESRYNPSAISSKGASGLTQLMPGTAVQLGVQDRSSVLQNLNGGARYLRGQLDTFGNWALALSAYNAGPGNVQKYRGIPPFKETRTYVRRILASIARNQSARGAAGISLPRPRAQLVAFNR